MIIGVGSLVHRGFTVLFYSVYVLFAIPYWAREFLEIPHLCISYQILVLFNLVTLRSKWKREKRDFSEG